MILKRLKTLLPTICCIAIFVLIILFSSTKTSYGIEIALPGSPKGSSPSLAQYVKNLFVFGLSLAGFLAVAAIAWGGVLWMMSGSITSVEKAKGIIVGAVSGLVLLLSSYLLLYTIDPRLVNLTPGSIQTLRNPTPIPTTRDLMQICKGETPNDPCTERECVPFLRRILVLSDLRSMTETGCQTGYIWDQGSCLCQSIPGRQCSPPNCTGDEVTCVRYRIARDSSYAKGDGNGCIESFHWDAETCDCVRS